ncbi:MAG: TVP38/TMEM64 family protein [Chromatiaceae bacterium]|nr:TVP38/TMEM64 family protein [Gammaproteobacteria bacterium]MCP5300890.1 TVP38/TMEM64 family protein [Chromatiaceae bacterium]MCP5421637.1 TVP38/TMEM64 family protein [Chromatiaceae bacterium]
MQTQWHQVHPPAGRHHDVGYEYRLVHIVTSLPRRAGALSFFPCQGVWFSTPTWSTRRAAAIHLHHSRCNTPGIEVSHATLRTLLVLLLAATALFVAYHRDRLDVAQLGRWIDAAAIAGPLLFVAIYAAATVLFLPGSLMTLAGGALFGPIAGTLYNLAGATLGAALAFVIARFIGGTWIERRAHGSMQRLRDGIDDEGWRFVAFTRLVPAFPFNLLNYALGLTRIRFWSYLVTSAICMLPGAAAYTYLGHAGRQVLEGERSLIQVGLIGLALLAVLAFLPRLVKRLRRSGQRGSAANRSH